MNSADNGNSINYEYTGNGGGPAYARNDYTWAITEEYVSLPGGVTLTIHPQETTQAAKYSYNLTNLHGDTLLTTDGTGMNTATGTGPANSYIYDPFGNPLASETDPANTDQASYGYEGTAMKLTETDFTSTIIQMGARVYLASIGRFASQDPIPGGNANAYVFALDPINFPDVSGKCILQCTISATSLQGSSPALQPTITASQIESNAYKVIVIVRAAPATIRAQAPAEQAQVYQYALPSVATVKGTSLTNIREPLPAAPNQSFNAMGAISSAHDWFVAGALIGGGIGCMIGAVPGAFTGAAMAGVGALPGAAVGCMMGGSDGAETGAPLGAGIGWFLGGYNAPGANSFEEVPDGNNPWKN